MLTFILVSIFAATFIFISVKNLIKKNLKSCYEFTHAASQSNKGSENVGLWVILQTIGLMVQHSRKDSTHHETVNTKLYEHGKKISKYYSKLKVQYFGISIVIPNSANSIRQFITNENCGGRFPEKALASLTGDESKGIMFADNDAAYKELRKYMIKTLGQLGFGKNNTMGVILDDTLIDFLEHLEAQRMHEGNKIQVKELFSLSVINIVWVMVGGQKFAKNDEKFHILQDSVNKVAKKNLLAYLLAIVFPFVLYIMKWLGVKWQSIAEAYKNGSEIFLEYIEQIEFQRRGKSNCDEVENNFVNQFLSQIEKNKDDDKLSKIYSKSQLVSLLLDIFGAAVDTTNNFMESFIMCMLMYPDVQQRLFLEIEEIVGNTLPSYSAHSTRMPYTQAVIMEIHRMATTAPIIARSSTHDCKIGTSTIKKNTIIPIMQAVINLDERYWGDPKIFRPERFLDADNNIIKDKINHIIPFGAGVRACPGEKVAKATIFTLVVGILQRYNLMKSDKNEFVGLCKSLSLTTGPEPFHFSLFRR